MSKLMQAIPWRTVGLGSLAVLAPISVALAVGMQLPTGVTPPELSVESQWETALQASWRIPLAATLGALLAFRPRRRGTPTRTPAVVQTQIILAIVGCVVMLVVGSNLARAFGVVGAAGLVRYRAKVEDNKDAGVMLSTLAVGLASGVGMYTMAIFSAVFILVALWIIESFEPEGKKLFELKVKLGDDTDDRRKDIDAILERFQVDFDLLSSSDEEICYEVWIPLEMQKERISNRLLKLDPEGHGAVEWAEKKTKAK